MAQEGSGRKALFVCYNNDSDAHDNGTAQAQTVSTMRIQSLRKTEDMSIYLLALSGQQPESESATGSLSLSSALQLPSYLVHHKEGAWVKGWPRVAGMPGGDRRSSGVRSEKREKSHRHSSHQLSEVLQARPNYRKGSPEQGELKPEHGQSDD